MVSRLPNINKSEPAEKQIAVIYDTVVSLHRRLSDMENSFVVMQKTVTKINENLLKTANAAGVKLWR